MTMISRDTILKANSNRVKRQYRTMKSLPTSRTLPIFCGWKVVLVHDAIV